MKMAVGTCASPEVRTPSIPTAPRLREGWVDFRAVKDAVSLERILAHYEVILTARGDDVFVGRCPLHKGVHNSNAFHVKPSTNAWKCFGDCRAGGNQLDFVMRMEGVNLRQAALLVSEWFSLDGRAPSSPRPLRGRLRPSAGEVEEPRRPLPFTLSLDPSHPYLRRRGLTAETVDTFGLGFCSRGLLAGRIAIPIRDSQGQLVAYAGRAIEPGQAEAEGKYRLPPDFKKGRFLYNLDRAQGFARTSGLVVVEGFFAAFHLHQAGIQNVVALMGTAMSETQERLLLEHVGMSGRVCLMLDRDEAGRSATDEIVQRLITKTCVRVVDYDAVQPDRLHPARVVALLGRPQPTLGGHMSDGSLTAYG